MKMDLNQLMYLWEEKDTIYKNNIYIYMPSLFHSSNNVTLIISLTVLFILILLIIGFMYMNRLGLIITDESNSFEDELNVSLGGKRHYL